MPKQVKVESLYTCSAVENLISRYVENGGEIVTVQEGVLGYGLTICYGDGLKTAIITEVCLNEWSSAHKIRLYNKMPKKYELMLEQV